jgi:O-acetylhomoserine/O-acetylserine sulfhydrylase-like pyridoxal-dependent enzyme
MPIHSKNPETMVLHAGPRSDGTTGAVAVPIVQTTSYQFRNTEHAANLFALKEFGNVYSRIMNPTCDALEQRVAALEGGVAALAVSSGQAASAIALQNLCRPGDNVVSSTDLYGGTWNLFANERVIYAGMHENAEQRRRSNTYLKHGYGGLVGFELKGGSAAGARFIDALQLFYHVANIGDARSLAIHPASTTHSQLGAADQLATGVTPGYVRLSVGIEHIDDIIADLDQALAASAKPVAVAA